MLDAVVSPLSTIIVHLYSMPVLTQTYCRPAAVYMAIS